MLINAGSTDKSARSFLGGLRKQHGDSALIDTLRECIRLKPVQPLTWMAAALPPKDCAKSAKTAKSSRHKLTPASEFEKLVKEDGSVDF